MSLFQKKHDVTDIYGVKSKTDSPFTRKGEVEAPESGRRHSDYYHKYFRGYTEIRHLNEKGRITIERLYTQPWIISGLTTSQYWLVRVLFLILTVAAAVLFLIGLGSNVIANYSWQVAAPGYITIILLFLLVVSTLAYIFVERKMTLWGHTSSTIKLRRFSLLSAIGQGVTAIVQAVMAFVIAVDVKETLFCSLAIVIGALCALVIYIIEGKLPYKEIPNDTKLPNIGEAHEIW